MRRRDHGGPSPASLLAALAVCGILVAGLALLYGAY
jgi:hypothetical protein